MKPPKLQSFHFSCGDSSHGPVGFCARIVAWDKQAALKRLRSLLAESWPISAMVQDDHYHPDEYFSVYFNDLAVTVGDIDEVADVEAPEEEA
jgi:hypothetical protein